MSENQRKHKRLPVDLLFKYEIIQIPEGISLSQEKMEFPVLKDISQGGARIIGNQLLHKNTILKISVMPLLIPGLMHIKGRVCWNKQKGDICACGIQFIGFSSGSELRFKKYLAKLEATPARLLEKLQKDAEKLEEF